MSEAERPVSARLAIAIVFVPLIFSWFTLRQGYSTLARVISLGWAALVFLLVIGGAAGDKEDLSKGPPITSSVPAVQLPSEQPMVASQPSEMAQPVMPSTTPAPVPPPPSQPIASAQPEQISWVAGLPGYDIKSHCNEMGSMAGNVSYGVIEMCQRQEMSSAREINGYWTRIPADTQAHCKDMASMGGTGSYGVLDMCIKQEMSSRSRLGQ